MEEVLGETKQERKTRLARIRQAKWYAKNAEKKKEKQKENYVPKENPKKGGRPKKETTEIIIPEPITITRKTSFTQDEIISIIMNDRCIFPKCRYGRKAWI